MSTFSGFLTLIILHSNTASLLIRSLLLKFSSVNGNSVALIQFKLKIDFDNQKKAQFIELNKKIDQIEIIDLTGDRQARLDLMQRTGQRTVPQIYINDVHVGGYDELRAKDARGENWREKSGE